jgi:hypothetical protein
MLITKLKKNEKSLKIRIQDTEYRIQEKKRGKIEYILARTTGAGL